MKINLNSTAGELQPGPYLANPEVAITLKKIDNYNQYLKDMKEIGYGPIEVNPVIDKKETKQHLDQEHRPDWFPKTEDALEKWKSAYNAILSMEIEYQHKWDELEIDNPKLKLEDFRDRLIDELKQTYSTKTIGRIKRAGDNGWLK